MVFVLAKYPGVGIGIDAVTAGGLWMTPAVVLVWPSMETIDGRAAKTRSEKSNSNERDW